jgi:hypothetical protein
MEPLFRYFEGEKQAATLAVALGIASIAFAVWLFRGASPFRAMWIPLALVALAQLGVGIGLHLRTPAQVAALEAGLRDAAVETRAAEIDRMQRVMRSFRLVKLVELALLVLGTAAIFALAARPTWVGLGLGLLVEAAVMLAFDVFAEQRGVAYLAYLEQLAG